MSSSICIPNMTLLACKVVEKSLTKKCYGITDGRMDGRTDGMTDRCKPVYPPPTFSKRGYNNNDSISVICPLPEKAITAFYYHCCLHNISSYFIFVPSFTVLMLQSGHHFQTENYDGHNSVKNACQVMILNSAHPLIMFYICTKLQENISKCV